MHTPPLHLLILFLGLQLPALVARADCTAPSSPDGFQITPEAPLITARLNSSCLIQLSLPDCEAATPASVGFTYGPLSSNSGTVSSFLSTSSSCTRGQSTANAIVPPYFQLPNGSGPILFEQGSTTTGEYATANGFTLDQIVKFAALASSSSTGSVALPSTCPANLTATPVFLCVVASDGSPLTATQQFIVQTAPPPVPETVSVTPLDSGLDVSWTEPSSAQFPLNFQVVVTNTKDATDVHRSPLLSGVTTTSNHVNVTGLQNGVSYSVVVKTFDNSGINADFSDANEQDSSPQTGTPVSTSPTGTSGGGGCASGGATWLALLGLGLWRRRQPGVLSSSSTRAPG